MAWCRGYTMSHAVQRYNLAGRDMTNYAIRLLGEAGCYLYSSSEKEMARRIKGQSSPHQELSVSERVTIQSNFATSPWTMTPRWRNMTLQGPSGMCLSSLTGRTSQSKTSQFGEAALGECPLVIVAVACRN